ncbi:Amidophosphoribosyltransferase 2, chloroplastic [Porphyridium purpureum]|uniref:Amidophosphoribosyltransferase n=1 Tax=Porphyridium purpureum TaxID=35688 RepID=A0A5J4YUY7_PORPP|nr:Amidophosphoribosyltransferase 2, chloroplastic [Porphyridium purpureum]|eukprot:POR7727..scf227_4
MAFAGVPGVELAAGSYRTSRAASSLSSSSSNAFATQSVRARRARMVVRFGAKEQEVESAPEADGEMAHFREECGVMAVYNVADAARVTYFGLHTLQHRGQEGAGIVVSDGTRLKELKGLGLVSEVFTDEMLNSATGNRAIGHVRYSTSGEKSVRNVQPFTVGSRDGSLSICHNGNLTNAGRLRAELELRGSIFNTSSDTETVLHLMATSVYGGSTKGRQQGLLRRAADALNRVEGAYSIVIMTKDVMIAVRDPRGFRPLVMGRLQSGYIFASETCALDIIGAEFVREVEPGEMVVLDGAGIKSLSPFPRQLRKACVFEHIYFSKPSSLIFGRSVYMSRYRFGQILAQVAPVDADVVIPVPDSGIPAALGYAAASGIEFQHGIMRSSYVGRTFIQPTQSMRDIGVKLKLAPVTELIAGKDIVVVDDSIVRGTTSRKIVKMLREAGARKIHVRIACPPILGGCYYGVDTPDQSQLISHSMTDEEVCEYIGADSLSFVPLKNLRQFLGDESRTFCDACFSLEYPVPPLDVGDSDDEDEEYVSSTASINALGFQAPTG